MVNEEIRALSWKNPYASLMLHGKIETRTWNTNYRGLVLICSSQKSYTGAKIFEISGSELVKLICSVIASDNSRIMELNGYAIAIGKLVDCRFMQPEDEEKCFVKYSEGLYCHIYEDMKLIKPFRWKGSQGWRTLTDEQKQLINIL